MSPRAGAWSRERQMFRQAQHDSFLMSLEPDREDKE